jgi:hypothetical protein
LGLNGILLSEISQREKEIYCLISHVRSEKVELIEEESRMVVAKG